MTLADEVAGDITTVSMPETFGFGTPRGGGIDLAANTAEVLLPILGSAAAALPPCTHLQPVDVRVLDPDGNIFAKAGIATEP